MNHEDSLDMIILLWMNLDDRAGARVQSEAGLVSATAGWVMDRYQRMWATAVPWRGPTSRACLSWVIRYQGIPDPRRVLWPAVMSAALKGRTHGRTVLRSHAAQATPQIDSMCGAGWRPHAAAAVGPVKQPGNCA